MSPHEQFASVMGRIAVLPNIARTRREDAVRAERQAVDFDGRVRAAVERLKKDVAELEKALV